MSASPERTPWEIRPYRPGDEAALVPLFARVFGRDITEDHWRWKLKRRPSPVENVWLGVDDGRIVFQYAGIPLRIRLPDRTVDAMMSVDTMTAPENTRKGLLTTIGRHTYDTWAKGGIAFVFGLPNERWGSRLAVLGLEHLFHLDWLVRPLRPEAILARRLRFPPLRLFAPLGSLAHRFWNRRLRRDSGVNVREVTSAGPEFDRLWERVGPAYPACLVRDRGFVSWRYFEPPLLSYRVLLAERSNGPVAYAAFRLGKGDAARDAYLAELFVAPDDRAAAATLLLDLFEIFRSAGADKVYTLAAPGNVTHETFRSVGFRKGPGRWSVVLAPFDAGLPMQLLREPKSWFIGGGDTDVI